MLQAFAFGAQVRTAPAEELERYWQSKRGGRIAPARKDIDPLELPGDVLPHIFMIDVIDAGGDFRYRLIGTGIVGGVGRDATGALFSQLYGDAPGSLAALRQMLRRTIAERAPVFVSGDMNWLRTRRPERFEAVFLPLSADNANIDIVFGGLWVGATP